MKNEIYYRKALKLNNVDTCAVIYIIFITFQRPYMTIGTFREQVIYPDTHVIMQEKGISDEDLADLLEKVYIFTYMDY